MAVSEFCDKDYVAANNILKAIIDVKPMVRGFRKLMVLTLEGLDHSEEAEQERNEEQKLPDVPSVFVHAPPLPDEYSWLIEALAPKADNEAASEKA